MWKSLVHVCRRWRSIIFASPRRLCLVLQCDAKTRVRKLLDTWPPLPIIIRYSHLDAGEEGEGNIIAALGLRDRITGISFEKIQSSEGLARFTAKMRKPFPALTQLHIACDEYYFGPAVVPKTFFCGSAPQLRSFTSHNMAYLELPKLVLSSARLVTLSLRALPTDTHYISPEMMVTYLAAIPTLEEFSVGFRWQSLESRPDPIDPPRQTRVVLPALNHLRFQGASKYLEDFVALLDTPVLNNLSIVFFIHNIFHVGHLCEFIDRAETFKPLEQAFIELRCRTFSITLRSPNRLFLEIRCNTTKWGVSLLAQLCNDLSPHLSRVGRLEIRGVPPAAQASLGDAESAQWVKLFHPFTAVQSLYASKLMAPLVAPVLQEPTLSEECLTDALPALRDLVLEGL